MFRSLTACLVSLALVSIGSAQGTTGGFGSLGGTGAGFSPTGSVGSAGRGATGAQGGSPGLGAGDITVPAFGQRSAGTDGSFIGANRSAMQGGFIGAGNQQGFGGQNTRGGQTARGGQFGNVGAARGGAARGNATQGRGQQGGRGAAGRVIVRTKLSLGFNYPRMAIPRIQTNLDQQFTRIDQTQADSRVNLGVARVFEGAQITTVPEGRTVILRGQVASERERNLAAQIARLEPGVDAVRNELTVASLTTE